MITIKEAIIVEGKYDKMRLKSVVNATIIETNGFRIFKDKEKVSLIKQLAEKNGIIVLTDSDSAGFVIRNHLKNIVPKEQIKHAYIPQIKGKEKRKATPSKEGTIGVEGIDEQELLKVLKNAGVTYQSQEQQAQEYSLQEKIKITKVDLFKLGLTGRENSHILRCSLLKKLNLPQYITTNALLDVLNSLMDLTELTEILKEI
ncbi:MAG: DUF4093 domain-containing protein [Acutalibacteraceae bacterium]|nr:DUF4093 domain-containing protein [Acutalibacteraceae bacterium]